MVPYVGYDFYHKSWGGSLVKEAAFDNIAIKATCEIDRMTFGRIMEVDDNIRMATCAVIDFIKKNEESGTECLGKKSETVGNLSVTYDESMKEGNDGYQKLLYNTAYPYLLKTGLLYRGVNSIGY